MAPKVTVLITAYNVEKYIGRAIRSILNQSVERATYEIIIVEDHSTDRTRFALDVFKDEIRLIINKKRLGLPASLNRGIRKARGQFLVRLDGDDYVHRDFIKILEMHLAMNEGIDAIACDYLFVDNNEKVIDQVNCFERPIACGIMFRIEQIIDIGLYDENFLIKEDEDLRIRFLKKFNIDRVKLPLYRYRRHNCNMTNNAERVELFKKKLDEKHKG